MIDNNDTMKWDEIVDYWHQWLRRATLVFTNTVPSRDLAEVWADMLGMPDMAAMETITKALFCDEQATRLGRVLPADVLRLLNNQKHVNIPSLPDSTTQIWSEKDRVGWLAGSPGYDDYAVTVSHPLILHMINLIGWTQICESTNRAVTDAQLRGHYQSAVDSWREGRIPQTPTNLRFIIGTRPVRNALPPVVAPEPETNNPMTKEQVDELRRLLCGTIKHVDPTSAASARKALATTTPPVTVTP